MTHDLPAVRGLLSGWSRKAALVPLLLCRVTLGWEFLVSGWLKLPKQHGELVRYFASLGIPAPAFNAVLVTWTELVCGALLLVGLLSRVASVPLFISMTVAILTAKRADIHGLSDLFYQVEFAYICMLLVVFVLGPGAISLDGAVARWIDRSARRTRRTRGTTGAPALAPG